MKRVIGLFLVAAASLLGTTARAQDLRVKATIPFDFVVSGRVYSAGEYTIRTISETSPALSIRSEEGNGVKVVLSNPCNSSDAAQQTKLVFSRVGDSYFLHQIWTEGSAYGRAFAKSKAEVEMAANHDTETVVVAANITR
jgi:hypothetical protein